MRFRIYLTAGREVNLKGLTKRETSGYFEESPETAIFHVDIVKFGSFLDHAFASQSFGASIDEFVFALEIADLGAWGDRFTRTRNYITYRPKQKLLLSVGQIEWRDVKALALEEQLRVLADTLMTAIDRLPTAKRKPKDFDSAAFAKATGTCQ